MPSLLLGWPNKREGEQKILHTFSDNTGSNDRLGFKKALPADKSRNTPDLLYQNNKIRGVKSFLCTFLPFFHSLPFLQPLYE